VRDAGDARSAYAPSGLDDDPAVHGLSRTVVPTPDGDVLVHHRPGDGSAPVTVMLHGAAGSWTTWTPYLRAAAESGRPVGRPVLVDLPGWGGSPAPSPALDVDAAARVVLAVADALGADRFELVGHSLGALVALHVAARHPERVVRLGLVSPTTFAALEAAARPWSGVRRLPALVLLRAVFAVLPRASSGLLRAAARLGLLTALSSPVFRHARRVPRSVREAFVAEVRPVAFVVATRSAPGYDTGAWAAYRGPASAVAGADDAFAQLDDLVRLRGLMPQCRTTLLPECGHFAHVEWPSATVDALG
jgi:pimeloyl-ACP methyl ester carboxylesterase